jgi:hypothetical protein
MSRDPLLGRALGPVDYEDSPPMYENKPHDPDALVSGKRWRAKEVLDRAAIHLSFLFIDVSSGLLVFLIYSALNSTLSTNCYEFSTP